MAKRIRVSDNGGTTWYTLPGSSGEKRVELSMVNDTIYGQSFQSENPSLGQWQVTGNSYFKGVAGYIANLQKGGTPITMTDEATTQIGSTKSYQITAAARRMLSHDAAIVVKDGSNNETANVIAIDYNNGIVTFAATYTVTGPVTVTADYVPLESFGCGRSFTLTQQAAEIDESCYENVRSNGGLRIFSPGLRTVGLEVGGVFQRANGFTEKLLTRDVVYVSVSPDNTSDTLFRGSFKYANQSQSGDVGALEEETISLSLYVPDSDVAAAPFNWYLAPTSKLNIAVQKVLLAWQNETPLDIQYLDDGTNGWEGEAIVTEASLANQLDGQNEFSFTFRGSGPLTPVP